MAVNGSRFTVTDAPSLAPGADLITKSAQGPFIDTGYDIPFAEWRAGSRVYLSFDTVREIADVAGILDHEPSESEQEAYARGFADGLAEIVGAQNVVDAVGNLGYITDLLSQYLASRKLDVPRPVAKAAGGKAAGGARTAQPKQPRAARAPQQNNRPARKQGRADVPAAPGDGALLGV